MKEDVQTIKEIVMKLLMEKPSTRDDDQLLHYLVLEHMGFAHRVKNGIFIPWKHINDHPAYESITRCRRKMQEEHIELAGSDTVREHRQEQRKEMECIDFWFDTPHPLISCGTQKGICQEDV